MEDYVDSTSRYQTGSSGSTEAYDSSGGSIQYMSLLHEYCVPGQDIDYFIHMFDFTKENMNKS